MKVENILTILGVVALATLLWRRAGSYPGYESYDPVNKLVYNTAPDGTVYATNMDTGERTMIFTPL